MKEALKESNIPKWERELRSFLGIKSGMILEGNIYDQFPMFDYKGEAPVYQDTDDLDQTMLSLVDEERTEVFFFDPIDGFYCYGGDEKEQKSRLEPLFRDYDVIQTARNHGSNICMLPGKKKSGMKGSEETQRPEAFTLVWMSEIVRRAMADKTEFTEKENIVFVLNFASRLKDCNLRDAGTNTMFLNLMEATTSIQTGQSYCSSFVMVVDKYNDIPAWVYLNNPNIRTISICVPDRATRRLFLNKLRGMLAPFSLLSDEQYEPGKRFVAETEGMRLQELRQILLLAYRMDLKPDDIEAAFRLYKFGISENPWEKLENDILVHIEENLTKRVKGQDEALKKVKAVVTRAVKGLSGLQHSSASHKPKGILFFAGPTGVGKTETAKTLAESIFGDENACIRFDMSEYRSAESDQKLFGAPPGYIGYEGGGQLTNAVKNRPFCVLLFDEIEKASPTIMDKFLQILEDGRMTDNQGNTVFFGETIIIFTSNIGLTKEVRDSDVLLGAAPRRVPTITIEDPQVEDSPEFRQRVKETLTQGVKSYFTDIGRPELLNRLGEDNIVVFQFINVKDAMTICDYKLEKICENIKQQKDIEIRTGEIIQFLRDKAVLERSNGGRGVGNMLEREFLEPFAVFLCTLPSMPAIVKCRMGETGVEFEVMDDEA